MMTYTLPESGPGVIRDADHVRLIEGASGWGAYEAWLAEGNTPSDAVAPPPQKFVPYSEWLALFTTAEREWAFSSTNASVVEAISRGAAAGMIGLSSPTVVAFLDLCISLGSPLTAERKTRVLSGLPPI